MTGGCFHEGNRLLRDVLADLRQTYSASVGAGVHVHPGARSRRTGFGIGWNRRKSSGRSISRPAPRILDRLIEAEAFEQFLDKRFIGKKRFSMEGGESTIAALDEIAERAAANGVQEIAIGMAHRGRLNVLANIIDKPIHQVFAEFEEAPNSSSNAYGSGDVKYHLGAIGRARLRTATNSAVSVAFNPSHLEAVDPVVRRYRPRPAGHDWRHGARASASRF